MRTIVLALSCLLLVACGDDLTLPPDAPQPVTIQIQGAQGVVSSMPLNTVTVADVQLTHIANGQAALRIALTDKGAKSLYAITSTSIGSTLQVYSGNQVISAAPIESPMGGSVTQWVIVLPDSTPSEVQAVLASIKPTS